MKAVRILDEAKDRLLLKSDYALAKASGIPKQRIQAIRAGKEGIPLHLAYWLAITLERDPAALVAELEEEREKNPSRKAFWGSFLSRAVAPALCCCTMGLGSFGGSGSALAANGGLETSSHNLRLRRTFALAA